VVSTLEDRLAGDETLASEFDLEPGSEGLSLREAVTIANNTPENDLIVFDDKLFKAGAASSIVLESTLPIVTGGGTVIDARANDVSLVAEFGSAAINIEGTDIAVRNLNLVGSAGCGLLDVLAGQNVQIEGNRFETEGSGIIAAEVTELIIRGNTIVAASDDGINVSTSGGVTVEGNTMTNLLGRGVVISDTSNVRVHSNQMIQVAEDQIVVRDGSSIDVAYNEIIINNKTTQKGVHFIRVDNSRICDNFIDPGEARLISLSDSNDNLIEGNILDRGDAGVALEGTSSGNMVFRNVIIESAYDGIYVSSTTDNNTIVHNTIHNASSALVISDASNSIVGNNLVTDLNFAGYVDAANYDFHLAPESEHIDAGELLGYDCVPGAAETYWGAAPDLGAVETK
jgi:parallel beta-helix repeat protein